jgi:hypothetical protein
LRHEGEGDNSVWDVNAKKTMKKRKGRGREGARKGGEWIE